MRKILSVVIFFIYSFSPFINVYADSSVDIPDKGLGRISWAVQCSGNMPVYMRVALILLIISITTAIIYYKKISGGER